MTLKNCAAKRNLSFGVAWLLMTAGCGSSNTDPSGTGGAAQNGGASQGGMVANGGSTNPTGGSTVTSGGMTAAGGAATSGGSASGGSQNGGNQNGGSSSGGATGSGGESVSGGPGAGGSPASGGSKSSGGASNTGGSKSTGGAGGKSSSGGSSSGGSSSGTGGGAGAGGALAKFSFFVVSYPAIIRLSGKAEGFGGDLRFNKADGLSGADEICRQAAEGGMPGAGQKQWRAFLSVTQGPNGSAVNARDRIGAGPWYDARGRLVANNLAGLFSGARPAGDTLIVNDLPNELGDPNHYTGPAGLQTTVVDNHDTLTGSNAMGNLATTNAADTCNNWTSTTATGRPYIGHSWPRSATNGTNWVSDHTVPGCAAGVDRTLMGTGTGSCVGCSGGYGGFYCFALP